MDNQNAGNPTYDKSVLEVTHFLDPSKYLSSRKRQLTFRVLRFEIPTRTVLLAIERNERT